MEGIVKQASSTQYWELWNCQKLSPEFELKRRQILKLNQVIYYQLCSLRSAPILFANICYFVLYFFPGFDESDYRVGKAF